MMNLYARDPSPRSKDITTDKMHQTTNTFYQRNNSTSLDKNQYKSKVKKIGHGFKNSQIELEMLKKSGRTASNFTHRMGAVTTNNTTGRQNTNEPTLITKEDADTMRGMNMSQVTAMGSKLHTPFNKYNESTGTNIDVS